MVVMLPVLRDVRQPVEGPSPDLITFDGSPLGVPSRILSGLALDNDASEESLSRAWRFNVFSTSEPRMSIRPAFDLVAEHQVDSFKAPIPPAHHAHPAVFRCLGELLASMCAPLTRRMRRPTDDDACTSTLVCIPPPRRWYRVLPQEDLLYFVRPDAGFRGRMPGVCIPDRVCEDLIGELEPGTCWLRSNHKGRLRWRRSLPAHIEGRLGLPESTGFECDTFRNCCRICYESAVSVVVLPCKHGGLCEDCLRKSLFSRPPHRGGRQCPFCRRRIKEVLRLYRDGVVPQYAYTIKAG
eukprot:NODE_16080_length_1013_cov_4.705418.p1 GENE.NODE_16080_length_1013_cov_4.705418~~NODE_16080_length_1013_cov_4.705418.p1  ORF type:complete len:312 (+),score=39.29 NODE_16080_length_1013_cov_4.705418:51-938(+)